MLRRRLLLPVPLAVACTPATRPIALPSPFAVDSQTTRVVAPGVVRRSLYLGAGPWAVHLLDVDPTACWTLDAAKAGAGAVGRAGTLALARAADAVGGVNADFFSLTGPQGVPTSLHVQDGVVVTGPSTRPSLLVDRRGRATIGVARAGGYVVSGNDSVTIGAWNRSATAAAGGVAFFDRAYGARTDSVPGRLFVHLTHRDRVASVIGVDSGAVTSIDSGGVLVVGPNASPATVATLRRMSADGVPLRLHVGLTPANVKEAVSGFPVLVRGGDVDAGVDTAGAATFRARNPRSAVALLGNGHVLLAAVDGRQAPYSDGMTLRELAELLRALRARDALNLDGGGSTTLVARGDDGALQIVNRPSDREGERPVGNALLVRHCR